MHTYINFKILTDSLKFIFTSNFLIIYSKLNTYYCQNSYSIARNKIYLDDYSDNYIKINNIDNNNKKILTSLKIAFHKLRT